MKKYSKSGVILITIGMIFAISIFIESNSKYYQKINYRESDNKNLSSGYAGAIVFRIADKDTWVNSYLGDVNYGGSSFLLAGYTLHWDTTDILEAHFHFPFYGKPFNWVKAEISLDIRDVSSAMNLSYCIIEEPWGEYTMTFSNRPARGTEITQLVVTQDGVYRVDVSNFIGGRNDLSICVYINFDNIVLDYVNITSREGYISVVYAPMLIWTGGSKMEVIPAYVLFVLLGFLSVGSIIIAKKIEKN